MPVIDGVGQGPHTEGKQRHFASLIRAHIAIASSFLGWQHSYRRYVYVDLNAGPGLYADGVLAGQEGSPLIFLRAAQDSQLAFDAFFCERRKRLCKQLQQAASPFVAGAGRSAVLCPGDNAEQAHRIACQIGAMAGQVYGLVYADPNGALPVEALRAVAAAKPRLDVLVYASANGIKRSGRSYFLDDLRSLGRPYVWLREPIGRDQWTFALLSGWHDLGGRFRKDIGLHSDDSPRGREIAERMNWSDGERWRRRQPRLPFDDSGSGRYGWSAV